MATATEVLPLVYKGTLIEPAEGLYVRDLGKTFLHSLYQNSIDPNLAPVLGPDPVRAAWQNLKDGQINPQDFYSEEFHKPYGAEAGDLKPMVEQLAEEMHDYFPFVNGVFVVDNKSGLVLNLGNTQLPAFATPVGVYTEKTVKPNSEHGITLDEFKQAGGKLVAYKAFRAGQYQLKDSQWTSMPEGAEEVGVMPKDQIYANLDPNHSDGVKALGWCLLRPGGGPSCLYAYVGLDDWGSGGGVLRGRRLNAASSYQEKMNKTASELERLASETERLARQLRI